MNFHWLFLDADVCGSLPDYSIKCVLPRSSETCQFTVTSTTCECDLSFSKSATYVCATWIEVCSSVRVPGTKDKLTDWMLIVSDADDSRTHRCAQPSESELRVFALKSFPHRERGSMSKFRFVWFARHLYVFIYIYMFSLNGLNRATRTCARIPTFACARVHAFKADQTVERPSARHRMIQTNYQSLLEWCADRACFCACFCIEFNCWAISRRAHWTELCTVSQSPIN